MAKLSIRNWRSAFNAIQERININGDINSLANQALKSRSFISVIIIGSQWRDAYTKFVKATGSNYIIDELIKIMSMAVINAEPVIKDVFRVVGTIPENLVDLPSWISKVFIEFKNRDELRLAYLSVIIIVRYLMNLLNLYTAEGEKTDETIEPELNEEEDEGEEEE